MTTRPEPSPLRIIARIHADAPHRDVEACPQNLAGMLASLSAAKKHAIVLAHAIARSIHPHSFRSSLSRTGRTIFCQVADAYLKCP